MAELNDTSTEQSDAVGDNTATAGASASTAPTVSPAAAGARKKRKGAANVKSVYGKNNFRLPAPYERALRYISLLLEITPQPVSVQELIEDAVVRHVEYLRKKGIEIPEAILPTDK